MKFVQVKKFVGKMTELFIREIFMGKNDQQLVGQITELFFIRGKKKAELFIRKKFVGKKMTFFLFFFFFFKFKFLLNREN